MRNAGNARLSPSAGFLHALAGIAMTIFSWYSPWAWPALPALTLLELIGGETGWLDHGQTVRGVILVTLIIINVSAWGALSWLIAGSVRRLRRRSAFAKPGAGGAT